MMYRSLLSALIATTSLLHAEGGEVFSLPKKWPSIVDEETGRRIYQITDREGNNMSFYYLFKNRGRVGETPYLVYRNTNARGTSYVSVNLSTGEEKELTPRGMVGTIAEAVGEYLYAMKRANSGDDFYSQISRWHLGDGREETIVHLDTNFRHSANLTVNADGTQVLFFRAVKGEIIDLLCANISDGTQRIIVSNQRMSHIQFGPVDPHLYIYLNKDFIRRWKMVGVGWVDPNGAQNALLEPTEDFFKKYDGELIPSHPYWDADGQPIVDMVDTSKPYTEEWNVRLNLDREKPGQIRSYEKTRIKVGEFQLHSNPGPSANYFVGDGDGADWSHKPGFGSPFIHKLHFDFAEESIALVQLASNLGTYWKSGELEPNARYIPDANLVVWSAFRTLDGKMPAPTNEKESEAQERSRLWSGGNSIKQNVFAVRFSEPGCWDFAKDEEGWHVGKQIESFQWARDERGGVSIEGEIAGEGPTLLSPGHLDLPCEEYGEIFIRLKNETDGVRGKVYFSTDEEPEFSEERRVQFAIEANSADYVTYRIPLSTHPQWKGRLQQLRIDPSLISSGGKVSIRLIRLNERE